MTAVVGIYLFAMSLGASAIGGMLGMAGGVLVVPLLTAFGVPIRTAIAASIVSVIACSCGSAAPFLWRGLTNVRLAIVLELATTLGAFTGVFLTGVLPTSFLFLLFAVILFVSAHQMFGRRTEPVAATGADAIRGVVKSPGWEAALRLNSTYADPSSGADTPYVVRRLPIAMVMMYGAGLVSALLGIGSGVLKIPAMDTALRLPLKVSAATSNFMIGVTAAASAGAYFVRGDVVSAIAGPVALGSVVGAVVGARILLAVSSERIRLLFVGLLIVLAAYMAGEAFRAHASGYHA